MYWVVAVMTASVLGIIGLGIYLELRPMVGERHVSWYRGAMLGNVALFFVALLALLFLGVNEVMAQPAESAGIADVSLGTALAILGAGLPTAVAAIGAAMAVRTVGSSAMALIAERPEMFGRTLVYLGLAEGIAIYGLVVSILILGRL